MKSPICGVCLNSDILCKACKAKVDEGLVTSTDIKVSRIINRLSGDLKLLKDVSVKKVLDGKSVIVIVCEKGDASKLVGKGGVMVKKLSKTVNKSIRVIEDSKGVEGFMGNLLYPVPVMGINIIYTPEKEIYKVIIPKGKKIPIPEGSLNLVTKEMFGREAVVSIV